MNDQISRQAAIDSIRECAEAAHDNHEWDMEQGYLNAIECLEEEPSAQHQKPDHGYMWICPECGLEVHSDFNRCIRCGYEREDKWRWIPVTERLPEKEGWYITTVERTQTGKRRIENDLFAIEIAVSHHHTPHKFCKDGYRQKTIAWMPLPEPWEGG